MNEIPAVLLRYMNGLKAHDLDRIADTVADDLAFVTPTATLTKEQFLRMLRALYSGFLDWHYDHDAPEVRGEVIAVKWRQGGTHTGTFALPGLAPVPATNRKVQIPEQHFFYRVRGDRIVEIRPEPVPGGAPRGILEQIGVPVPPLLGLPLTSNEPWPRAHHERTPHEVPPPRPPAPAPRAAGLRRYDSPEPLRRVARAGRGHWPGRAAGRVGDGQRLDVRHR